MRIPTYAIIQKISLSSGFIAISRLFVRYKLLVLVMVLAFSGCSTVPEKPLHIEQGEYGYAKEYLSWMIENEMRRHDVKGLSIAIVDDRRVVWAQGFGYADVENKRPATPETVYRIGSISKLFSATEAMRLVERGDIELDVPITRYLPDFSVRNRFAGSKPITVRSILAHHSGLPTDYLHSMWTAQPESLEKLIEYLQDEDLVSPPQTMYRYSNAGFSVLGRVIEVTQKDEFVNVMRRDLLQPMGMRSSSFEVTPQIEKLYSKGYRNGNEAIIPSLRDIPAGSMLSSVDDLARYLTFIFSDGRLYDELLLRPQTLKEMFQPQFVGRELDFGHQVGLAWILSGLSVDGNRRVAWHNGGYQPFQAHLSLLPDDKLGVVILANTDEASKFITRVGTKALALALEAKYARAVAEPPRKRPLASMQLPREKLEQYAGNYVVFQNLTPIGTTRNGLEIKVKTWGIDAELMPVDQHTFMPKASVFFGLISIPLTDLSLEFRSAQGRQLALLKGLPAPIAFERVPDYSIPQAWMERVGEYVALNGYEELDFGKFVIKVENGILLVETSITSNYVPQVSTEIRVALMPISDTEAVVIGLGNSEGGTVRATDETGEENLYYSGFRFKAKKLGESYRAAQATD